MEFRKGKSVLTPAALLALFVFSGAAHAGSCNFTLPSNPGDPVVEQCGTGVQNADRFSLPQFDPGLGQLQDVLFEFDVNSFAGTAYISYGDNSDCAPFYPPGCVEFNWAVAAGAGASLPSLGTIAAVGTDPSTPYLSSQQGGTIYTEGDYQIGWVASYPQNISNPADLVYLPPSEFGPFTGTGQVTFDIVTSANALGYLQEGPGTVTGVSLAPVSYSATVVYTFVASPEPGFAAMAALAMGFFVVAAARRNHASRSGYLPRALPIPGAPRLA